MRMCNRLTEESFRRCACKMTKQLLHRCTAVEPALRPALEVDVLPALRQLAGRAKSRSITAAAAASCHAPAMLVCPITQV